MDQPGVEVTVVDETMYTVGDVLQAAKDAGLDVEFGDSTNVFIYDTTDPGNRSPDDEVKPDDDLFESDMLYVVQVSM